MSDKPGGIDKTAETIESLDDEAKQEFEAMRLHEVRRTGRDRIPGVDPVPGRSRISMRAITAPEVLNEAYDYSLPSSFSRGLSIELLSGDRTATVERTAEALGIAAWRAECTPGDKVARLEALAKQGRRVLMVGDGLNDAPALAAASVSLSPSSAIDISQTAADAVFQGSRLWPVAETLTIARHADRLVRQNFTGKLSETLFPSSKMPPGLFFRIVPFFVVWHWWKMVMAICL